jgi:hypothetical protein
MCVCYTMCLCICYTGCSTLDARLLARSQYLEGPATVHWYFLVSLCLQANADMVPKFPSRYYIPLM